MPETRTVLMRYGRDGLKLQLPASAEVLEPADPPPGADDPRGLVEAALAAPVGCAPLEQVVRHKLAAKVDPKVAITISDITRPVPNRLFLPPLLDCLNRCGVADRQVVIIVGTGLHRRSTPQEHAELVGPEVLARGIEVVDHDAQEPSGLVEISGGAAGVEGVGRVRVCRRFAQADLRIVTGFIEPHFMAGFSGGRKGVCPALVDLETVEAFHGYRTLADERATTGRLHGNPCHDIALSIARQVGVDFLLNVALTPDKRLAAVYAGDLEQAHAVGCRDVAGWTQVRVERPFDLVITSGGGYPLDLTYYQTVKGMVAAMPAAREDSTLLVVSQCAEGLGSDAFAHLVCDYGRDWQRFVQNASSGDSRLVHDQWQFQMQIRVLKQLGVDRLLFASDGLPLEVQRRLAITPLAEGDTARERAQAAIDSFLKSRPTARIAAIPDGPYTMLA